MKKDLTFLFFLFAVLLSSEYANTTNVVPNTAIVTGQYYIKQYGTGKGTSWSDAAPNVDTVFNYLASIGSNVNSFTFWVAKGKYTNVHLTNSVTSGNHTLNILKVDMYGGFNGDETSINDRDWINNKTVLEGNTSSPALWIEDILLSGVIDGFNIAYSGRPNILGAALRIKNSPFFISHCRISPERSGMRIKNPISIEGEPQGSERTVTFINSLIADNVCDTLVMMSYNFQFVNVTVAQNDCGVNFFSRADSELCEYEIKNSVIFSSRGNIGDWPCITIDAIRPIRFYSSLVQGVTNPDTACSGICIPGAEGEVYNEVDSSEFIPNADWGNVEANQGDLTAYYFFADQRLYTLKIYDDIFAYLGNAFLLPVVPCAHTDLLGFNRYCDYNHNDVVYKGAYQCDCSYLPKPKSNRNLKRSGGNLNDIIDYNENITISPTMVRCGEHITVKKMMNNEKLLCRVYATSGILVFESELTDDSSFTAPCAKGIYVVTFVDDSNKIVYHDKIVVYE